MNAAQESASQGRKQSFARGLARAFGGAILFGFPLLMTMEMWWLGFYMDRLRLFVLLIVTLGLLVPLSYFVGFERTGGIVEDIVDAFVAFGIGVISSIVMLATFAIIDFGMPADEILGKIAVQSVPASIGAILARGQMASEQSDSERKQEQAGFAGQLFIMLTGAVFLAFNVAPTEEMILIGFKMSYTHALVLVLLSIALLHAFVFALDFRGGTGRENRPGFLWLLVSHSIAGYGIALLVSLYVLWTFGRTDGSSLSQIVMMTVVLGFPAALGAASARLVI